MIPMFRLIAFALVILGVVHPTTADWDKGLEAHQRGDIESAFREWSDSAEKGHADSQYNVGLMYLNGAEQTGKVIVERDLDKAVRMISLAASQDQQDAMYYVGLFYIGDFGIPQDPHQAYCWFERVARLGYPRGYFALGRINLEGIGGPRDVVKAHAFLSLAVAMGHEPSKALLESALGQMTDLSQVDESMRFLNEWGAPEAPLRECELPRVGSNRDR